MAPRQTPTNNLSLCLVLTIKSATFHLQESVNNFPSFAPFSLSDLQINAAKHKIPDKIKSIGGGCY